MERGRRAASGHYPGHGIGRWLLPASLLHAAVLLLAAALSPWGRPTPQQTAAQAQRLDLESSLELTLLDDGEWSMAPNALPPATSFEAIPLPANDERRVGRVTARVPQLDAAGVAADPSPPPTTADSEPPREAPRVLSLEQLGVGTNPFLDVRIEPLSKEEQANARLHAALHPPSLERDRQRGFSPAGPVAAAARRLVLADDGLVESSAVLNVRVDGAGHVTGVQVFEASGQIKAWQMIAARLARALDPVTLRAATSQREWGMKLRLSSSLQLPSGAAPGMRMGVLGQQVAGSGGPGSTSLELSPTSKLDLPEPIDNKGRHMDQPIQFEVMLLKFRADPTDIGAPARRVVEVAVLSIDEPAAP